MAILKSDLQLGSSLLVDARILQHPNPNVRMIMPGVMARVVSFPAVGGVGLLIPGWLNGHNLSNILFVPNDRSGFNFSMEEVNLYFRLVHSGAIPATEKIDFDSVILADKKKAQIIHALKQIDNHNLIFVTWGFGKTFEKGKGVSMLFYGPPGTGKTLMAQAIAHKLDYKLNIISNADIQSSVPGEAERNLRKHFTDNKGTKSILLFDECDSLIYTRQATGPILGAQINELLSQLERFEGVTIFTTNRLGTLDEAVNRRLSIKVEFAMPDLDERVKIWKRMFPAEAPLATIDWKKLARHKIAGGHIKNAVLRAAREAAAQELPDGDKKITMKHLLKGLSEELEGHKQFLKAKAENERRGFMPRDGMVHEGGKLSLKQSDKTELKRIRQSVGEMKDKDG